MTLSEFARYFYAMDFFRIVLLVRPGDAGPVVAELLASGYPVQRATSPADAVRLAGMGPCFLLVDGQNAPKLGPDAVPALTSLVQSGVVRICLLDRVEGLAIAPLISRQLAADDGAGKLDELSQLLWMNQRASVRAEVALHATFLATDGAPRDGSVRSLSEGGALFVSQEPPPMGASGRLRITDQDGRHVEVDAQVVNERRMEKGAGLRFVNPDAGVSDHLRRLVTGALGIGSKRAAEHVLAIYDPSKLARRIVSLVLSPAGYEVAECASLAELVRVLGSPAAPAALLLDPTAKELGGDRLKDITKRAAKTKVIFYTSAPDDVLKKAQAATGVQHHIKKGAFADQMIGRIGVIISG